MKTNLPIPKEADYKRREEIIKKFGKGSEEHMEILTSFNWQTQLFQEGEKYGLKTPLGEVILDAGYEDFKMMTSEELKKGDRVVAQQNGMWGVLIAGTPGTWIIEPEYDNIGYPNNITFLVKGDEWKITDLENRKMIVEGCEDVSQWNGFMFANGVSFFKKNSKYGVIMMDGKHTEAVFEEFDFDPDLHIKVKLDGKWGVIDENDQFTEEEDDAYYMPYDH